MRYLMLVVLFAMLILSRPKTSSAVAMDDYPGGTYQQSCKNINMRGDDLRARCKDNRGRYHDAVLDGADRCWGDIANSDGRLVCEKNGTLPSGGYAQTCKDVRVRYGVLRARCQDRDGDWRDTSLEAFSRCGAAIENIDGQLRCMNRGDRDHDFHLDWIGRGSGNSLPEFQRGESEQNCERIRRHLLSGAEFSLHPRIGGATGFCLALVSHRLAFQDHDPGLPQWIRATLGAARLDAPGVGPPPVAKLRDVIARSALLGFLPRPLGR